MNKKLISIITLSVLVIFCLAALALAQDNSESSYEATSENYSQWLKDHDEDDESSLTSEEEFFNKHGYYPPYSEPEPTPEEQEQMDREREKYEREKWELEEKVKKGLYSEPYYPPQTKEEKEFWEQRQRESDLESQKMKENNQIVKNVLDRVYNKKYNVDIVNYGGYFDREALEDVITILKTQTLNVNEKKALQIYVCEQIGWLEEEDPLYADGESLLQDLTFDPWDPYGLHPEWTE